MIYLCSNTIKDDAALLEGETKNASGGARSLKYYPDNTNLIADPTDFSTGWTTEGVTMTNDYAYTPAGILEAGRMVADAGSARHGAYYLLNDIDATGKWLRMSALFKYVNYSDVALSRYNFSFSPLRADIETTSVLGTSGIEDYQFEAIGDNWHFLEIVFDGSTATHGIYLRMTNGNSDASWTAAGTEEIYVAQPYAALYEKKRFFYSDAGAGLGGDKLILSGTKKQLGRTLRVETDASYTPGEVLTTPTSKSDWTESAFGSYKSAKFSASGTDYLLTNYADLSGIPDYAAIDFWFAGWVKVDYSATTQCDFLNRWKNTTATKLWAVGSSPAGTAFFLIGDASSTLQLDSTATIGEDVWAFVCCYHENGVGINISVNGGAYDSAVWTTGCHDTSSTVMTSNRTHGAGNYSDMSMMCWATGKGILGTKGRDYLYNNGVPLLYSEVTDAFKTQHQLVSYWDMTEESGNRADSYGTNTLTDTNTVASGESIIKAKTEALTLYSSNWVVGGLNNDDLVLDETISSQDAFGVTVGDGASASSTAYTNSLASFYVSSGKGFDSPIKDSISFVPNWGTFTLKGMAYKIRETMQVTFEYVTQTELDAVLDDDRLRDEPIYLYDDSASILVDKVWHCILADINVSERFNDYYEVSFVFHRLREYV